MKMRPKRHQFVGLITIGTGFLAVGYLVRLIWGTQYAQTGRSQGWLDVSNFIIIAGDVYIVLLSLFIGQGYLISHPLL